MAENNTDAVTIDLFRVSPAQFVSNLTSFNCMH